jgi:Zn-dependent peptidase ImmA (M78 family)/transcriptional regulator with XRE-family HTH domain
MEMEMRLDPRQARLFPQLVPERLKEAREARGYTREAFADAIGVTPQAVAQYETGQRAPGPEVMPRIIALTAQPPAFFTGDRHRAAGEFGVPFWRSMARMRRPDRLRIARRLEWAADVVAYIERFIEMPSVTLPAVRIPESPDDFETIEATAEHLRDEWALGFSPIRHLAATLESKGIVLIRASVNCEDMDSVSRWQTGRPYILLADDRRSLPRENYNLAHELAHLLLHPGIEVTSENINSVERQASYFAGAFLLPRQTFTQEVLSTSIDYFIELKARWRVSIQAMIYRCKDLGILSKNQVSYLWRQLNSRGIRQREPLDDAFEPERPSILSAALNMLIEHRVQSRAQIVDQLRLNPEDIESLCGTEKGFLDQRVVPLELKSRTVT